MTTMVKIEAVPEGYTVRVSCQYDSSVETYEVEKNSEPLYFAVWPGKIVTITEVEKK